MNRDFSGLKPALVWKHFVAMCAIPHPSHHEEKIRAHVKGELERMLKEDREGYEKFFKTFGRQLKIGCLNNYGAKKDFLQDLLLFYSSTEKKMVTLREYVDRMSEEQKIIYYATGENQEEEQ